MKLSGIGPWIIVELFDVKGIDVAQPICSKTAKKDKNAFFACF
jgi:hypothetical protein